MGNLGSKKKQKTEQDTVTDDVWIKLNDGEQKSPKSKKKKKKKRKKKGKGDSPDREDGDASQCDSYSYSTLSSRRLSDSTIASTGTVTQQNQNGEQTSSLKRGPPQYTDDQSNGSIGYVTASDTFATPPSPRKGHKAKFSPVIARDSPRVVRRLLQSEKIIEVKDEPTDNLSPRAKFFLTTPELSSKNTGFENRKFNRHSSGSSLDSKTIDEHSNIKSHYKVMEDKTKSAHMTTTRGNETSCITNGSLLVRSRQGNTKSCDSRISNNSLEMSDSTQENLVRTGEKAKWVRYDSASLSPSQRRKFKNLESTSKSNITPSYERSLPSSSNKIVLSSSKAPSLTVATEENIACTNLLLNIEQKPHVPPPSPASGMTLSEVDENGTTAGETSGVILTKEDELFGDSVCKRLSLLLESEQDSLKLGRTEFHEFTDSHSSSPKIQNMSDDLCGEQYLDMNPDIISPVFLSCPPPKEFQDGIITRDVDKEQNNDFGLKPKPDDQENITTSVKTPQGNENASVLDVMNNNFRTKPAASIVMPKAHTTNVNCEKSIGSATNELNRKSETDIEKQMIHDNEMNEKLIEEQLKMLTNIMPSQTASSKRSSTLFSVNNKHANDPDNYILVTKKTYCVKRGILVELVDEEKDLITNDVVKTIDAQSEWIPIGSEEKYRPEFMWVEKGNSVSCPLRPICAKDTGNESDTTESFTSRSEPDLSRSETEPDYVNLEDFERHEREFEEEEKAFQRVCYELELEGKENTSVKHNNDYDRMPTSEEEIDYDNILNRSQSPSESDYSDSSPKRESEILCDVIKSYKEDNYSEYSESEGEIVYADEVTDSRRAIGVLRTPSKLDQSLQKIFQEKAKQIAAAKEKEEADKLDETNENNNDDNIVIDDMERSIATGLHSEINSIKLNQADVMISNQELEYTPRDFNENMYENAELVGDYSKHSSDSSRRSLAYTESDLDASEQWDDDDASNDSMLADDEDDDDDFCQIIYSKPYTPCVDHDQKEDAMFSFNMVKTLPESPIVWEPEQDDDDVFQDDIPNGPSIYNPNESFEVESSDEAFDDARKQMQDIHEQLQSLRNQMHTFDEGDDSSLPTSPSSPYDDRQSYISKPAK